MKLYKTTIVIWSDYNGETVEIEDLARDATSGSAYCAKQQSVEVDKPFEDPDSPCPEFFGEEE